MSNHIGGKKSDVAGTVFLPGDPLRAKYLAEKFLKDPVQYNAVRNMLGFTGLTADGKKVSVQGAGIGMPSLSVYVNELMDEYGVTRIIRLGTCGALQEDLNLRDIVIAQGSCTDSGINRRRFRGMDFAPLASWDLLRKAHQAAGELSVPVRIGNIVATDLFYNGEYPDEWRLWASYGVLAVEMESAELYTLAARRRAEALTILTVSDSLVTGKKLSSDERESTLEDMMKIALKLV